MDKAVISAASSGIPHGSARKDDAELLRAFVEERNDAAFQELVERHTALVFAAAFRRTGGDRGLAEEAAQNTFIALFRKAARLRGVACLAAWLHRAAVFESMRVVRHYRTRERHLAMFRKHSPVPPMPPSDPWASVRPHVDELLARLSSVEHDLLILHYVEGIPFKAIAARLGTTPEAAQKRCRRTLAKLSRILRGRGITAPVAVLAPFLGSELAPAAPVGLSASLASGAPSSNAAAASLLTYTLTTMSTSKALVTGTLVFVLAAAIPVSFEMAAQRGMKERSPHSTARPARSLLGDTASIASSSESAAKLNLAALARALKQLQDSAERDEHAERAICRLMYTLDHEEVRAVNELILGFAEKLDRLYEISVALYARWAELAPQEAAVAAADLPPEKLGYYPLRGAVLTWAQADWPATLQWLTQTETSYDLGLLSHELVRHFAGRDGPSAVEVAQQMIDAGSPWDASHLRAALDTWVTQAPEEALDWMENEPDEVIRDRQLGDALESLGETHPATALIETQRIANPDRFNEVSYNIFWSWLHTQPQAAFDFFEETGGIDAWPQGVARSAVEAFARHDAGAATAYAQGIEDEALKTEFFAQILQGSIWSDPGNAAEAFALLPGDDTRGLGTLSSYIKTWAKRDPAAAAAAIVSLPESLKRTWASDVFQGAVGRSAADELERAPE
ncbi:MAG TPA: sigma-70 family RNA polymerase sigma factor [Verrucomicrobiales bacterium]|nr:sigma-70 family RNA polymerase sigma factor [Verrucomicrobiales bacterium]